MEYGTRVKHKGTDALGTVVADLSGMLACAGPNEVSVLYAGDTCVQGTDPALLEVLDDSPITPDLKRCGAGRGAECCIFLVVGASGPECHRHDSMRWSFVFRKDKMNAQREPTEPFPGCLLGGST